MPLVSRAIAVVIVGVIEPIAGAKEQASQNEDRRQAKQNNFNVHVLTSLFRLEARGKRLILKETL